MLMQSITYCIITLKIFVDCPHLLLVKSYFKNLQVSGVLNTAYWGKDNWITMKLLSDHEVLIYDSV